MFGIIFFFKMYQPVDLVAPELSSVNMFELLLPAINYARMQSPVSSFPQCLPSNGRDIYNIIMLGHVLHVI